LIGGHVVVNAGLGVTCPTGGASCSVSLTGTVSGSQAKSADLAVTAASKSVVVGTLRTNVTAGRTLQLSFRLNSKGATLLRKHHKLTITLSGSAQTGTGPSTAIGGRITISNPPKKRNKHR
jgi:hypothetical protein